MSDDFTPINWTPPADEPAGVMKVPAAAAVSEPIFWPTAVLSMPEWMVEEINFERQDLADRLRDQWEPRLGPGRVERSAVLARLHPFRYRFGLRGRPAGPLRRAS